MQQMNEPNSTHYEQRSSSVFSNSESTKHVAIMAKDDNKPNMWKPIALSWPALVPAIVYDILVIITLSVLIVQQLNYGAVYFPDSSGDSATSLALFGYLPILSAVIYSVYWGWIDLCAKRLEPWYQLSKPSGSSLASSLALRYPTDFAPFIPWKAARRGHHVVMAASSVMVIIFWAITPLQGALFTTTKANSTRSVELDVVTGLAELGQQRQLLGTSVLTTGYGYLWVGQSLPAFTTQSHAILPYRSTSTNIPAASGGNLTYETLLYETELECWAPVQVNWSSESIPEFDDGRGCQTTTFQSTVSDPPEQGYVAIYRGYYDDPRSEPGLAKCPRSAAHRFLGIWARADVAQVNFTDPKQGCALFCESKYYKRQVQAIVSVPTQALQSYTPLADKVELLDEEFNRTHFEYMLWNGVSPRTYRTAPDTRGDYPDLGFVYQDDQLGNYSLVNTPSENMVGFSIGMTKFTPEEYMDPASLARSYEAAHKLLFALAIQKLTADSSLARLATAHVPASLQIQTSAVTMNTIIAYVLCGFFVISLLLTFYLLRASFSRPCQLVGDPNSLRRICNNVTDSQIYQLAGQAATRNFCLKHGSADPSTKFHLSSTEFKGSKVELLSGQETREMTTTIAQKRCKKTTVQFQKHNLAMPYPFELTRTGRTIFFGTLLLTLAALCIIYALITVQRGIFFTLRSSFLASILLNYVPVLIATIIEPIWVLLARHACTLQSFVELAAQPVSSQKTLDVTYSSFPPQIVQFQALKNRHYLLAAMGTATLFANVLSLAMSSLFTLDNVEIPVPIASTLLRQPQFNDSNIFEVNTRVLPASEFQPFYLIQSNIEFGTPLPPFLDANNYYLPVDLSQLPPATSFLQTVTTGIGTSLDCTTVQPSGQNSTFSFQFSETAANFTMRAIIESPDGQKHTCTPNGLRRDDSGYDSAAVSGDPSGRQAMEIWSTLASVNPYTDLREQVFCYSWFVASWLRTDTTLSQPSNVQQPKAENNVTVKTFDMASTSLICKPRVHVAKYAINVTETGHVLSAALAGEWDDGEIIQDRFANVTAKINSQFSLGLDRTYHNDTFASDWSNYLIKRLTNNTELLDAQKPPPGAEKAKRYINDVYARAFAAQLFLKKEYFLNASLTSSSDAQVINNNEQSAPPIAQAMQIRQKLFMSSSMFWLAIAVLIYDLIVMVSFSWSMPQPFLRHVPGCILGVLALFEGGRAMQEFTGSEMPHIHTGQLGNDESRMSTVTKRPGLNVLEEEKSGEAEEGETRYAYGPFIGIDGQARVGIDIYPHAIPIHMKQRKQTRRDSSLDRDV